MSILFYVGEPETITLNSDDKHPDITLSDGFLTATDVGSNTRKMARANTFFNVGKIYYEATLGTKLDQNVGIGWSNADHDLTQHVGNDGDDRAYGYLSNGRKYNFGSYGTGLPTYTAGDVIMVAMDFGTGSDGKIWWGKNGVWVLGGDPENGTGEQFTSITNEPMTPAISTYKSGQYLTVNYGSTSFTYTVPVGFVSPVAAL